MCSTYSHTLQNDILQPSSPRPSPPQPSSSLPCPHRGDFDVKLQMVYMTAAQRPHHAKKRPGRRFPRDLSKRCRPILWVSSAPPPPHMPTLSCDAPGPGVQRVYTHTVYTPLVNVRCSAHMRYVHHAAFRLLVHKHRTSCAAWSLEVAAGICDQAQ